MNSEKNIIKKYRFYPAFLYFLLEKWLKKMSSRGWHLVARKFGVTYYFEKGKREEKEYFAWNPTYTGEGRYSIPLRYPELIKTYGVDKKKSLLNRNAINNYDTIIEVDISKIDIRNNLGYNELKSDRNQLYTRRFVRNAVILGIVLLIISVINLI